MNLKAVTDAHLLERTEILVRRERALTIEVLHHLQEISLRRLHATLACSSLFDYCTRVLHYSEAQAQRRIDGAEILGELPEIEARLTSGALKISHLSQAATFFRKFAKSGRPHSRREKLEILFQLESLSTRAAERILLGLSDPQPLPPERVRPLQDGFTELRFSVDEECWKKLIRLRELWNMPGASLASLLSKMAETSLAASEARETIKPKPTRQRTASPAPEVKSAPREKAGPPQRRGPVRPSRYIPASVRAAVWRRDGGRCEFTERKTGTRCSNRHRLEVDHVIPFAKGGAHTVKNLRLRCRLHNQRHAVEQFGARKMSQYFSANAKRD